MLQALLTPEVVQALLAVMATVLAIVGVLLIRYVRVVVKKVGELVGVRVQESQLKQLDELIYSGIGAAEEYAHNAARALLTYTPKEKLLHAVKTARELAPDELKPLINETRVEAALPVARARMSTRPPPPPAD